MPSKQELYDQVDAVVLTGGNRTKAAPFRALLKSIIDQAFVGGIKNYYGSVPPNNSNNASQGYSRFSRGYTTLGSVYECLAADDTTATWYCIYGSGD